MHYVYLIESLSVQGQRYVGLTADLRRRLEEHNADSLFIRRNSSHGTWRPTSLSRIRPKRAPSNDISNPVQAMHLQAGACGRPMCRLARQ